MTNSHEPTHYTTLGVRPNATPEQIRRAYRDLAKAHHPDVSNNTDSASTFAAIARAYETLSDPERRREYDHQLAQARQPKADLRAHYSWQNVAGQSSAGSSPAQGDQHAPVTDLDELYDTFFGTPKPTEPMGNDVRRSDPSRPNTPPKPGQT